ncbi:MAG: hypothetical protein ABFR62_08360 [Bacteroidota bacterium]
MESEKYIEDLAEIRNLMNKSSKFLSLSGISGVLAGIYALIATYVINKFVPELLSWNYVHIELLKNSDVLVLISVGLVTLVLAITTGVAITFFQVRKENETLWNTGSKLLFTNLMIPLAAGGIFSLILIFKGMIGLIAPVTLIFYGLALVNGSKYTHEHIKYLGFAEILLGLLATYFVGNGLFFWAVGFGVLHIVYGIYMYVIPITHQNDI